MRFVRDHQRMKLRRSGRFLAFAQNDSAKRRNTGHAIDFVTDDSAER